VGNESDLLAVGRPCAVADRARHVELINGKGLHIPFLPGCDLRGISDGAGIDLGGWASLGERANRKQHVDNEQGKQSIHKLEHNTTNALLVVPEMILNGGFAPCLRVSAVKFPTVSPTCESPPWTRSCRRHGRGFPAGIRHIWACGPRTKRVRDG